MRGEARRVADDYAAQLAGLDCQAKAGYDADRDVVRLYAPRLGSGTSTGPSRWTVGDCTSSGAGSGRGSRRESVEARPGLQEVHQEPDLAVRDVPDVAGEPQCRLLIEVGVAEPVTGLVDGVGDVAQKEQRLRGVLVERG